MAQTQSWHFPQSHTSTEHELINLSLSPEPPLCSSGLMDYQHGITMPTAQPIESKSSSWKCFQAQESLGKRILMLEQSRRQGDVWEKQIQGTPGERQGCNHCAPQNCAPPNNQEQERNEAIPLSRTRPCSPGSTESTVPFPKTTLAAAFTP